MRGLLGLATLGVGLLTLQNCGNPYGGYGSAGYKGNSRGKTPFASSSMNDYRNRIDRFDNNFSARTLAEKLSAGALSDNASPTPGHQTLIEDCRFDNERPCSFSQFVVNLRSVLQFTEENAANVGGLKIFVTKKVNGANVGQHINTLVLPAGVNPDTLFQGTYDLNRNVSTVVRDEYGNPEDVDPIPSGFSISSFIPETWCSVAQVARATGRVEDINQLIDFNDLSDEEKQMGVAHCPLRHTAIDYRVGGKIDLKIDTEPLPGYEGSRHGIKSLGAYGFPENPENKSSAMIYEMAFKTTNGQNDHYLLYTFFYEMFVWPVAEPEGLGAYEFIGAFTPPEGGTREYYIYKEVTPYSQIKDVAQKLKTALAAQTVYALDINSQAESDFLQGKIDPKQRYWMGYDDLQQKWTWKPQSGSTPFYSKHGTVSPSSRFTKWHPNPPGVAKQRAAPADNYRRKTCFPFFKCYKWDDWRAVALNYGASMMWSDFDQNQALPVIFEVHYRSRKRGNATVPNQNEYGVLNP